MPSAWTQIHTDFFLASLAFQGSSGLPEDQFVNTFVFRNDNVFDRTGMMNAVETALTNFFRDPAVTAAEALTDWIPADVGAPICKLFDLGETPPRVPEERAFTGISPSGASAALPYEMAAAASYHNGGPGPRNRGRIFFGPLTVKATAGTTGTVDPSVSPDLRTTLANRMEDMATNPSLECTWVLWSRANNAMWTITGGWVDNAFDVQRKRGKAPATRTNWGATIESGVGGYPGGRPGDTSQWT